MRKAKKAFTLIEVMVAVLIISVVIMALFEMQGNNSHFFSRFSKKTQVNQAVSFFTSNKKYGFEKKDIYLDDLLSDFRLEDELRRKLKEIKIEIDYEELDQISMNEEEESEEEVFKDTNEDEEVSSEIVLEIGKTIIKLDDTSTFIVRMRIP